MILLDSNVLISLFRPAETLHSQAQAIFSAGEFLIPYEVLSEIYTVLLNREDYDTTLRVLSFLIEDPRIKITESTLSEKQKTINFLQQNPSPLSFTDALLLTMSQERQLSLKTFDQALEKTYKQTAN